MKNHDEERAKLVEQFGEQAVTAIEKNLLSELEELRFLTRCTDSSGRGCDDSKCSSNQDCKEYRDGCYCANK